jgi:recombination protein RecT
MSTTELAQRIAGEDKKDSLMLMLEHHRRQFETNLLRPDGTPIISPEKFVRVALTTIRTTPKLAEATTPSLLGALMSCAMLGLEPGGPLGQAYLVPFEDRKANSVEATLIIGYQGFLDLMYRSDRVSSVSADAVYERDDFYFERGTNAHIYHRPTLENRGDLIAVYGLAELVTGAKPFEVMSRSDIEKRRARAKTDKIWKSDYEAMARKTVIRQIFKFLPSSIEWQAATVADGRSFKAIPERLEDVPEMIDLDPDQVEEAPEPQPPPEDES